MKRWSLPVLVICFGLLFFQCSNKGSETRLECMDRCMKEQFVCAVALGPQLDNPVSTTATCISLYVLCYEKCPVASSRSTSTSSRSSSSSSRGSSSSSSSSNSGSSSSSSGN
ncbi:hypothetical protein EHQ59_01330 [Leptospira kemamanensis]|uniref:Cys-rich protein n=1 Tax=Leptospira kemamanensis TaxID=2484942 RepID=A0A4V3JQI8_9LEPT|nr:hypothetical protein EHQ59_01330 [Leptospira kemamanensis]